MIASVVDLIKLHESCRLEAYQDGGGVWTIGYGHTKDVKEGDICTQQQAEDWLGADIYIAVGDAMDSFSAAAWNYCNDPRKGAMIDMAYNLGRKRFQQFIYMIEAVEFGNWRIASLEMLNSEWARQVGFRAQQDSQIIVSGEWPNAGAATS
jgi:lysozyme